MQFDYRSSCETAGRRAPASSHWDLARLEGASSASLAAILAQVNSTHYQSDLQRWLADQLRKTILLCHYAFSSIELYNLYRMYNN